MIAAVTFARRPCLWLGVALVVVVAVTACQWADREGAIPGVPAGQEQWVVVTYQGPDELEPILRNGPRAWDRVELRISLDDEHPTVVTPPG